MKLIRTTPAHPAYKTLIKALDLELTITDGDEHGFYDQFNSSEDIKYVVVAVEKEKPLACGAIKAYTDDTLEVKRMYTAPPERGRGLAIDLLNELERWAHELGYRHLILETGSRQLAAIRLYEKYGFAQMAENYGQYAGVSNSVCFEKPVTVQ